MYGVLRKENNREEGYLNELHERRAFGQQEARRGAKAPDSSLYGVGWRAITDIGYRGLTIIPAHPKVHITSSCT